MDGSEHPTTPEETPEETLRRIAADLQGSGVTWALVGGMAVSAWVDPRFTQDVDVVVSVESDAEAEAVVRRLVGDGYRVEWELEEVLARYAG